MKPAAALALLLCTACSTGAPSRVASMLSAFDEHPVQVAAVVVDLDTGETLLRRDAQRLFRPASTMKLLPTSAICRREHGGTFVTRCVARGVPEGEVVLEGGGDPLLTSEDLRALARELRGGGLVRAANVRVCDPLHGEPRFGEGWMWDDEPAAFMPTISGASVDGGCVTVEARRDGGKPVVTVRPIAGPLQLEVELGDGFSVERGRYRDEHVVRAYVGSFEEEVRRRTISVPDPARFAGHVLADALASPGAEIAVDVAAGHDQGAVEAQVARPVAEVVVHTNKVSDNLGAELLLRRLGEWQRGWLATKNMFTLGIPAEDGDDRMLSSTFELGREILVGDLRRLGVPDDAYRIADGSGVSHYNLVSADLLVRLLVDMHRTGGDAYELFRRSLPIAGVDGTLGARMKGTPAEGRVFAKTGTVSAVSNLAGYIDTRSGRRLAFAMLCQNFVGATKPWRELQDRVCAELAGM